MFVFISLFFLDFGLGLFCCEFESIDTSGAVGEGPHHSRGDRGGRTTCAPCPLKGGGGRRGRQVRDKIIIIRVFLLLEIPKQISF